MYLSVYFIEVVDDYLSGYRYKVHKGSYDKDSLSADLVQLIRVTANNRDQAVARALLGDGMTIMGGHA